MPNYRGASISFGPPLTRAVKYLLIITGAIFVVTYLPEVMFGWGLPFAIFSLTPYEVTHGFAIWQLATYLFLHWGFFHIFFNLFALWMFGCDLEALWGWRRFLFFFFLCGIGAGFCSVALQPSSTIPTLGNSGAVYGLLLAYGLTFPDRPIYLYMIIPIKAKWFALIMGGIEFVSSFQTPGSGVSHIAHLGGMLFAFVYLKSRGTNFGWRSQYAGWRRARLRRKFETYMRDHERKDNSGRWIN
jgi:rhomboid family protein